MVKLRLTRLGRHKLPYYRIIAIDSRKRRDGKYIKLLGTYNPFNAEIKLDSELALTLLKQGAQPSDTVKSFLKNQKVWADFMAYKAEIQKNRVAKKQAKKAAQKDKPKTAKQTAPKTKKTTATKKA